MAISIPLKRKYRNPNVAVLHRQGVDPAEGTTVWLAEAHTYRGRTGNCHGPTPKRQKGGAGKGIRRKSYGPWFGMRKGQ